MTLALIPQADLLTKVAAGTAFKADDATTAIVGVGASSASDMWGNFFTGSPNDLPTVDESVLTSDQLVARYTPFLKPGMGLTAPDIVSVVGLGQQAKAGADGLKGFSDHVTSQIADMPKNMNIFANVSALPGNIHAAADCTSKLGAFFGSVMGAAKTVLNGVNTLLNNLKSAINGAIAFVGGILTGIGAAISAIVNAVKTAISAAVKAVTDFIAAEVAALKKAVTDLIHNATTGLFPSLFKDTCVKQLASTVGNAITSEIP